MNPHVGELGVIHAGALQLLLRQIEAERPHQVQAAAGIGREAHDIAGVRGDFRLVEDDIEHDLRAIRLAPWVAGRRE